MSDIAERLRGRVETVDSWDYLEGDVPSIEEIITELERLEADLARVTAERDELDLRLKHADAYAKACQDEMRGITADRDVLGNIVAVVFDGLPKDIQGAVLEVAAKIRAAEAAKEQA